jgi:hypothetical protein
MRNAAQRAACPKVNRTRRFEPRAIEADVEEAHSAGDSTVIARGEVAHAASHCKEVANARQPLVCPRDEFGRAGQ